MVDFLELGKHLNHSGKSWKNGKRGKDDLRLGRRLLTANALLSVGICYTETAAWTACWLAHLAVELKYNRRKKTKITYCPGVAMYGCKPAGQLGLAVLGQQMYCVELTAITQE